MKELQRLIDVVARLRDPEKGCPWDSVQTNMSIRRYLVEEVGEYLDALEAGDDYATRDELGDILLQVVLNSRIAQDEGRFTLEDVAKSEADKMIHRHPHVFGTSEARTAEELKQQWANLKLTEKGYDNRKSALDGVPRSMPALARAQKLLGKAEKAGLAPLPQADDADKIAEAAIPVKAAMVSGDDGEFKHAIGQLLLQVIRLCRYKDIQAEEILQDTIRQAEAEFRRQESSK